MIVHQKRDGNPDVIRARRGSRCDCSTGSSEGRQRCRIACRFRFGRFALALSNRGPPSFGFDPRGHDARLFAGELCLTGRLHRATLSKYGNCKKGSCLVEDAMRLAIRPRLAPAPFSAGSTNARRRRFRCGRPNPRADLPGRSTTPGTGLGQPSAIRCPQAHTPHIRGRYG
jgi:hypothetical protein